MSGLQILNTGLAFTPERILKKYKPLRKVRTPLAFSLLYYPYFLASVTGALQGRFVKRRMVQAQMVVNGLSGSVYRLANQPDIQAETVSETEYSFLIQPPEITASCAGAYAQEAAFQGWKRKYQTLFSPTLCWSLESHEEQCVYKPYWVVSNGESVTDEMLMIVDGTTGLCGVPESMDIKKAWRNLLDQKDGVG